MPLTNRAAAAKPRISLAGVRRTSAVKFSDEEGAAGAEPGLGTAAAAAKTAMMNNHPEAITHMLERMETGFNNVFEVIRDSNRELRLGLDEVREEFQAFKQQTEGGGGDGRQK
jgi:hypothetical protein